MTASLKFYKSKTSTQGETPEEATNLSEAKYIVFTDKTGNNYSIDISNAQNNLQLGYKPTGGTEITHDVIDLYGSLSRILSVPVSSSEDAKSIFQTELIKAENVNALTDDTGFKTKMYTKDDVDLTFLKKGAEEADVTNLLNKITTADHKPITASELPTKIVDNTVTTALSNTFLKKDAAETDVTSLLDKIITPGQKPITVSELPTKIVDNTVTTALSNTFLKKDASNFDDNKQTDFLTKLGANNGNQLIDKIAEKVVSSNSDNTRAALMSVIENHNEEGLVPSYDTLW